MSPAGRWEASACATAAAITFAAADQYTVARFCTEYTAMILKRLRQPLLSALLLSIVLGAGAAPAAERPPLIRYDAIQQPVIARHGMVVSQRQLASAAGADILRRGGNAVDAAVATAMALAVTHPRAGNLGGGGFLLLHLAETGSNIAIDYREMAPAAAHRDLFLNVFGRVDTQAEMFSHRSAGVPGTVAGLALALERYGSMSWAEVLQPAIALARDGFEVPWDQAEIFRTQRERLTRHPATAAAYYAPGGRPYEAGEVLRQADLAGTLQTLAEQGPAAFYTGPIAARIAADMAANDGLITLQDLAAYRALERPVVSADYRGYQVVSMPPPSSGGVHIAQMLNVLQHFPLAEMGAGSADSVHLLAETARLAYADRSEHLGDPDYYPVPLAWLTSRGYAAQLVERISLAEARPSSEVKPGQAPAGESRDTTHFSVMDQWGNAVANTYTLNFSFGSGIVVPGTGMLLNNEMADFAAKPGVPNAFGLLGGDANSIQPGKRPLSSMTPTMILRDGKPWVVTGSPGGSRIITTVLQQIVNLIDHRMNLAAANHAPRMHHQWLPDRLQLEPGFSPDTIRLLEARGHQVELVRTMGSVQSIMWSDGVYFGAADPRRPGAAAIGVQRLETPTAKPASP